MVCSEMSINGILCNGSGYRLIMPATSVDSTIMILLLKKSEELSARVKIDMIILLGGDQGTLGHVKGTLETNQFLTLV